MIGLLRGTVASAVSAIVLALLPAAAASADELMLSHDGVTWHTDLVGGMFGGARAWVPGESRTGQLVVRNSTKTDGVLSLQLTGPSGSALVDRLLVRARIGSGPWSAQRDLPYDMPLLIGTVEGHAESVVTVRVTLDPAARLASASTTAPLGVTFRLEQVWAAASSIPGTGAPELRLWALLGGVFTGMGGWLVAGRRVRRRGEPS